MLSFLTPLVLIPTRASTRFQRRIRRLARPVAPLLLSALIVAGCSGGDETQDQAALDAEAEAKLLAEEEARKAAAGLLPGRPGYLFADCDICPKMVLVPAGGNTIGSPKGEPGANANEHPQTSTKFATHFAVSRYEINVREFSAFADETGFRADTPCHTDGVGGSKANFRNPGIDQTSEHPVVCVSAVDAEKYAAWLSKKTGHGYRLLSESEWEYVRRSKTEPETARTDTAAPERGNVKTEDWFATTTPGGNYDSNTFFVFDMLGNADEWTADCWQADHANRDQSGMPMVNAGDCAARAVRGGSWDTLPKHARAASRRRVPVESRDWRIGFRVMRPMSAQEKNPPKEDTAAQ